MVAGCTLSAQAASTTDSVPRSRLLPIFMLSVNGRASLLRKAPLPTRTATLAVPYDTRFAVIPQFVIQRASNHAARVAGNFS